MSRARVGRRERGRFRVRASTVRAHPGLLLLGRRIPEAALDWSENGHVYSIGTGTVGVVGVSQLRRAAEGVEHLLGIVSGEAGEGGTDVRTIEVRQRAHRDGRPGMGSTVSRRRSRTLPRPRRRSGRVVAGAERRSLRDRPADERRVADERRAARMGPQRLRQRDHVRWAASGSRPTPKAPANTAPSPP